MFSFVTGQSLFCTLIDIIDDDIVESKETISLVLRPLDSSPGVRISRSLSTVEIIDNDAGMANLNSSNAKVTAYHSVPGSRPLPGKRPCTAFLGVNIVASIYTYGSYVPGKRPCGPKS